MSGHKWIQRSKEICEVCLRAWHQPFLGNISGNYIHWVNCHISTFLAEKGNLSDQRPSLINRPWQLSLISLWVTGALYRKSWVTYCYYPQLAVNIQIMNRWLNIECNAIIFLKLFKDNCVISVSVCKFPCSVSRSISISHFFFEVPESLTRLMTGFGRPTRAWIRNS